MDARNLEADRHSLTVKSGAGGYLRSAFIRVSIFREAIGYFLVSLAALAADMSCYIGLIKLAGVHYLYAGVYGFLLGIWVNYLGSTRWVFGTRQLQAKPVGEFASFLAIGVGVWALNMAFIYGLVEWLAVGPVLAKWSAVGVSFCLNFGLRKALLFSAR